ncbi:hypothetical protein [Dethiothermospora halolimnae]|uniref:hypothetical protein n=1 Tax=Dethiothermospora halolimnae TaxID=3114390 RepID=UPI003CCB7ACF
MKNKKILIIFCMILALSLIVSCNEEKVLEETSTKNENDSINSNEKEESSENKDLTKEEKVINNGSIEPFNSGDAKVKDVVIGDILDKVNSKIGPANEIEDMNEEDFGDTIKINNYDFGKLEFSKGEDGKFYLYRIIIQNDNVIGPREIKVGDSVETVLSKFPNDNNDKKDGMRVLYGGDYESNGSGILYYDEDDNISLINYIHGQGGFGSYGMKLSIENNKVKDMDIMVQIN